MIETDISRDVAKVAVRVVQRDFESVFGTGWGELRTYKGSGLLKSVTGLSILRKAHIRVVEGLYHEIEEGEEKVGHVGHKGG